MAERDRPTNEVGILWNGKGISVKGIAAIFLIAVLGIIASNIYAGFRVEMAIQRLNSEKSEEHRILRIGHDRTSCVLAMDVPIRTKFLESYQPGAFKKYCPWVEE